MLFCRKIFQDAFPLKEKKSRSRIKGKISRNNLEKIVKFVKSGSEIV